MDRLEDCISFLIGKAGQQVARRARDKLSPHGVTPAQYAVLKVMWDTEGLSGAEIGARLVIDSATMTGLFDRLQAAGLVERRADGSDRRMQRLFLTSQGRALEIPLDHAMDELNEEIGSELGTESRRFWNALRRLSGQ